jgi:hypothetical protein
MESIDIPPHENLFSSAALLASHIAVTSSCGADQACVMRSFSFVDVEQTCMRCDAMHTEKDAVVHYHIHIRV